MILTEQKYNLKKNPKSLIKTKQIKKYWKMPVKKALNKL